MAVVYWVYDICAPLGQVAFTILKEKTVKTRLTGWYLQPAVCDSLLRVCMDDSGLSHGREANLIHKARSLTVSRI